jgi:excisionase family DNA binding protein
MGPLPGFSIAKRLWGKKADCPSYFPGEGWPGVPPLSGKVGTLVPENNPLNAERAADYLGVSERTLHGLVYKKQITYSKPSGKLLFFRREDLDAWAYQNTILADFEVEKKAEELLNQSGNEKHANGGKRG